MWFDSCKPPCTFHKGPLCFHICLVAFIGRYNCMYVSFLDFAYSFKGICHTISLSLFLWNGFNNVIFFAFNTGPSCVLVRWLFRHGAFRVDTPSGEVKWSRWRVCIFEKWQREYFEDKVPSFWHQLIHSKSFYQQFSFLFWKFFSQLCTIPQVEK